MIISCPECNKDVSEKARTCPHCGVSIYSTHKQMLNTVRNIASSKSAQRVFSGKVIPGFISIIAPIAFICIGMAILALVVAIFSMGRDKESMGALMICGPLSILLIAILNLLDRRKPNQNMRLGDYFDLVLTHIQRKQSHYPKRKRSYDIMHTPGQDPATAENIIRAMTDEIIIRNALLAWHKAPPDIPLSVSHLIYERDVSPYVEYLLELKSSEYGKSLESDKDILLFLRCYLDPLRDYEAIQNEIRDGILKDDEEYNRRLSDLIDRKQVI
jgi:RNA polymerase subunit RPABC4/transcription elongation factor Spt4